MEQKTIEVGIENRTMLTDLYQLTMNAAYFESRKNDEATFDMFIRKLPKDWGFFIANGIEDAIDYALNIGFSDDDIRYLGEQGIFSPDYLRSLRDFRFTGDIYSVREGTPIASNTPILRVTAPRMEAQLLETMILNTINFQTMIATKANRVVNAAGHANVVDFGLRRAQESMAGMKGARAAYIGGAVGTSNVLAGKEYGIPIFGTQAHSFVMSFPSELESFRAYAKAFPNHSTLLIDTYDTLQGAKNAVIIGKEMEKKGRRLKAVRLDSGDLAGLSKNVRSMLDQSGLSYVKILASNDLNEYKISELISNGARIDSYGVGTELITAKPVSAISGVYKLVEDEGGAKIKLSAGKKSYPGKKQVYRVFSSEGDYEYDILGLENENIPGTPLLEKVVSNGRRMIPRRSLRETREYCLEQVSRMPERTRELRVEKPYEMRSSPGLDRLISTLASKYGGEK